MSPVAYSYLVAKYQMSSGPYGPIFFCSITENTLTGLFAEELGVVLEVSECHVKDIIGAYEQNDVACMVIGHSVGSCGPEAQASYVLASISEKKIVVTMSHGTNCKSGLLGLICCSCRNHLTGVQLSHF